MTAPETVHHEPLGHETVRYDTVVTRVGALVPDFVAQKLVILFGEGAPDELHEMSVLHEPAVRSGGLAVGDYVVLDGQRFLVLAVGPVADKNLVNLGHIDLKFNGKNVAPLPGDVCLPDCTPPLPTSGSRFQVVGASRDTTDNEEF